MNWDKIITAYAIIKGGSANRVDGDGWSIYKVGNVIRLDIKEAK